MKNKKYLIPEISALNIISTARKTDDGYDFCFDSTSIPNEYRTENGDTRIHAMTLQEQDAARYGYGANFHPNEKTQQRLAEKIQAFIQNT